ncbi:hypothetical protein Tco_0499653 [Tanacetum coccineum]
MHPICFRFEYTMVENFKGIQAEYMSVVDIFDMVDIDLFTVVALNMMVLKLGYTGESEPMFYNYLRPITSLNEGLYALACKEDVRHLATFVRSFKLIKVYIEHGVTVLDSYLWAPRFRATLEDIIDEPDSIAANKIEKMLLLTWHESSENTKEPVCDSVIDDVMRQLSFDETELDGEASFADVVRSGVDSSGLSHDESFGVDDLDLNLNEHVNQNVSRVETQSELLMSEEPDVGPTQEPILVEVSTQEPIVAEVRTQEPIVANVSTESGKMQTVCSEDESALTDGQFFYDDEGIDTVYEVQSSDDACTYDDDNVDEDFLVNKENEIVEPDVDVRLFGISMDLPFDTIGVTNLVLDDVLEGEDVDVINANGFDSDPSNDKETKLHEENKFTTPKEAKDRLYLYSIESIRNLKLYKNDDVKIKARCDGKVPVQISMSKAFRAKAKAERDIKGDHVLQYSMLRDYVVELQFTNPNTTVKITVERKTDPSLPTRCLGDDIDMYPNLNFTFISDRQKVEPNLIYCSTTSMRSLNGVIDKCTGPFTPTATRVMESIKKKAQLMKVKWNGANKYQVSGSLGDQCIVDVNMALNVRAAPPLETWVNPWYWLSTWKETYSHKFTTAAGEGGAGVASKGSSHTRLTKRRVQTERISPQKRTPTQPASQPFTSSQVLVSETRNADRIEMGDGVTNAVKHSSGASEWSFS